MLFDDWETQQTDGISKTLLWEYDLSTFDWQQMKRLVVQRVVERGWFKDYYAALKLYGGVDNVREIIKEIPVLSDRDMNFVCAYFNLKKEELKCYTWKQSREERLLSE